MLILASFPLLLLLLWFERDPEKWYRLGELPPGREDFWDLVDRRAS